jgi:streptogramin lyase
MQVRHLVNRFLTSGAWMLALVAVLFGHVSATEIVGVDVNSGRLLYIQTPKTVVTIANTGTNPDAVILGPYQQIIYALAGTGAVHSFNPYTRTDATLATGLSSPSDIVLEPGCKSILVSDTGVNKIFRIMLANGAVTTFYSGPDTIEGLVYDSNGDLFANDDVLNATVEFNSAGAIINQTPSGTPLTTPDGLTYDAHTNALYATSNTGQIIYKVSMDLTTVSVISFPVAPVLAGIVSDGSGNLYVVGVNGTTSTIFKYALLTATQTTLNTVPGLDDIALIPRGPCIKSFGTDSSCGELLGDEESGAVPPTR